MVIALQRPHSLCLRLGKGSRSGFLCKYLLFFPYRGYSGTGTGMQPGLGSGPAEPGWLPEEPNRLRVWPPGGGAGCGMRDTGWGMRDEGCGMMEMGWGWRMHWACGWEADCGMQSVGSGGTDPRTSQWVSGGAWQSAPWHCLQLWFLPSLSLVNSRCFLEAGRPNVTCCRVAAGATQEI